jgi:hypothetical protein
VAELARRQAEEAKRHCDAEEKKLFAEVEAEFIGKGPISRESILSRWRYHASRSIPDVRNVRAIPTRRRGVPPAPPSKRTPRTWRERPER